MERDNDGATPLHFAAARGMSLAGKRHYTMHITYVVDIYNIIMQQ